ncbi:MAG: hypothetical protein RL684_518 [Pseudomonadota bacterium]|jgi:GNAT superfamily N-acetyltransferase
MSAHDIVIERLHALSEAQCLGLSRVLVECVEAGASVGFMSPLGEARAVDFWQRVGRKVARGERALFVAQRDGEIFGTVQLLLAQPDNQPHRADLAKMLVRPSCRRLGIGERLLRAAMAAAPALGRHVLVLDTASADAERLYERNGWRVVGDVPDFALLPDGAYCRTRFYSLHLDPLTCDQ